MKLSAHLLSFIVIINQLYTIEGADELVTIYCSRYPGVLPELCPGTTTQPTTTTVEITEPETTTSTTTSTAAATTTTSTSTVTTTTRRTTPRPPPSTTPIDYSLYIQYCRAYVEEYQTYCHLEDRRYQYPNLNVFCPGYRKFCKLYLAGLTTRYPYNTWRPVTRKSIEFEWY